VHTSRCLLQMGGISLVRVRSQTPPGYNLLRLCLAKVAELADAPDLGSGGETHGGSSPPFRTINFWMASIFPPRGQLSRFSNPSDVMLISAPPTLGFAWNHALVVRSDGSFSPAWGVEYPVLCLGLAVLLRRNRLRGAKVIGARLQTARKEALRPVRFAPP
jgi:hypothetical protein